MSAALKLVPPPPANAHERISRAVGWEGPQSPLPTLHGARVLGRAALEDEQSYMELLRLVRFTRAQTDEHDVDVMRVLRSALTTARVLWQAREVAR